MTAVKNRQTGKIFVVIFDLHCVKRYLMACADREDSGQPAFCAV